VRREVEEIIGEAGPGPPPAPAAASLLLAMVSVEMTARPVLQMITVNHHSPKRPRGDV